MREPVKGWAFDGFQFRLRVGDDLEASATIVGNWGVFCGEAPGQVAGGETRCLKDAQCAAEDYLKKMRDWVSEALK